MDAVLHITMSPSIVRDEQLRQAVLLAFCEPAEKCDLLENLSSQQWRRLLRWLDTSGMALYFLHRMRALKKMEIMPGEVIARLHRNLAENAVRTDAMFAELQTICAVFQDAGLSFAVLKGSSLWPHSVPDLALRSQLDLDFLVGATSAPVARKMLEARGYHLRAVSGRSWEFKTSQGHRRSLKALYQDGPDRSAELHITGSVGDDGPLLARVEALSIRGARIPVLSPADLLLGQGMHAFKHLCSEFGRTSHLLEFRRHVIARRDDAAFWAELRSIAVLNPRAPMALGIVTLLITRVMGAFAPRELSCWTVDTLPARIRLWVELYGNRVVFANFPGSKCYLLLQRELAAAGLPAKRSLRQALVPLAFPPATLHAQTNETPWMRLRRYLAQARFLCFRLRFHIRAGIDYLHDDARWQQHTNGLVS